MSTIKIRQYLLLISVICYINFVLYVLNIIYRCKKKVELLTYNLTNLQNKMHNMSDSSIDNIFKKSNVNESQQILIREILNTSKVQAKNKRVKFRLSDPKNRNNNFLEIFAATFFSGPLYAIFMWWLFQLCKTVHKYFEIFILYSDICIIPCILTHYHVTISTTYVYIRGNKS